MKRILSLVMVLGILGAVLGGCNKADDNAAANANTAANTTK